MMCRLLVTLVRRTVIRLVTIGSIILCRLNVSLACRVMVCFPSTRWCCRASPSMARGATLVAIGLRCKPRSLHWLLGLTWRRRSPSRHRKVVVRVLNILLTLRCVRL